MSAAATRGKRVRGAGGPSPSRGAMAAQRGAESRSRGRESQRRRPSVRGGPRSAGLQPLAGLDGSGPGGDSVNFEGGTNRNGWRARNEGVAHTWRVFDLQITKVILLFLFSVDAFYFVYLSHFSN
uniref:Uncharacterized protein n=1 Tax=Myotis myotis TaxID=51298 RepID=A0A7J7XIT6_MYOMY|nr:hypothetical protein mMyoMyo1_011810 [Myotis myotis]